LQLSIVTSFSKRIVNNSRHFAYEDVV